MLDTAPYRIPAPPPPDLDYDGRRERKAAWRLLGWSVLLFFGSLIGGIGMRAVPLMAVGFCAAMAMAIGGAVRALVGVSRVALANGHGKGRPIGLLVGAFLANLAFIGFGAFTALVGMMSVSRGRQLRKGGRVLLPKLVPGAGWAMLPARVEVDADVRAGLAAQWRENGRTEHASVAAFARLTMDLMALGAPPHLVIAAQKDALDEIRHTELCFSLARAIDGRAQGPGPFPEAQTARTLSGVRSLALAQLAVDSLVDGALNEGVSARIIATLARRCEPAAIQAALKELAADEGRHAAHGWDVVEWCLAEGGAPVARALIGAVRTLPTGMRSRLPEPARDGGWEHYGIHGHKLESQAHAKTRAELVMRVHRIVEASDRVAA
jgi:hypothetical protein